MEMNIYKKIIEVRKMVEFLQKDTQGYQYRYVSGSNVLGSIRPKMDEIGLILLTDISEEKQERYQWDGKDNKGNPTQIIQFVTKLKMKMTWINADKPEERLVSDWMTSGEDEDPAKANGKAHTYGERYYLLKFFNIPTDNEDPDAFQRKQDKAHGVINAASMPQTRPTAHLSAKIEPEVTLGSTIAKLAIEKFSNQDKFKVWLVENDLPESLNGLKDFDMAKILTKLREYKGTK